MTKKNIDQTIYTDDSIITLAPREFTRKRPATYLGENYFSTQLVKEIFSNALDEHMIGHGTTIKVICDTKNHVYTVIDEGQGFPINVEKDGETVLQAAFDRMNTSGKYSDDGVYGGSVLGLNGIGSKLTNFLSKWLVVTTWNNNQFEEIRFEDGLFINRETGPIKKNRFDTISGTSVKWRPDEQFFQNVDAEKSSLVKLFNDISALCPTLHINLDFDGDNQEFFHQNGLNDLVDEKLHGKELLSNRFNICRTTGEYRFDICMTYSTEFNESITAYVNYGLTEQGIHINTVKSLLSKQINKFASAKGLLKKKEEEFGNAEFAQGLTIVFNVKSKDVKYDSQTKTRVVDLDRSLIYSVLNNDFPVWLESHLNDVKLIIDRARLVRQEREAIKDLREGIRNSSNKKKNKFLSMPTKLVDADERKKRNECELYITEGDSAAGGLISQRDGRTQAVFPIRGKIINVRKANLSEIYNNQEVQSIVKTLGLEIDEDTGKLIYDANKLRYGKIVFATDADPDGYHIRLLLMNLFWWLCKELVLNGHIWVAIPPLYRITTKKNEYIYLTDDNDLNEYKKKHKSENYTLNRNKGLGEQDADELAMCILTPETRNIQQVLVDNDIEMEDTLELFMGDDSEVRKKYIEEHANEVSVDVE